MSDTTVGTSLTAIGNSIPVSLPRIALLINNTGSSAFSGFVIQRMIAGTWFNWLGGSDFASAIPGTMPSVGSTSPASLAGGSSTFVELFPGACSAIQVLAQVTSGSTTANVQVEEGIVGQ